MRIIVFRNRYFMILGHLISLVLCLCILKCATIEDESELDGEAAESQERITAANHEHVDMFSRYLNDELFHKVLQYVARSPGKMAMTSKKIGRFVLKTRFYRFYEGAGWDMPELANVSEFDIPSNEMNIISSLKYETNEQLFYQSVSNRLMRDALFKELATSVMKYLVRIVYTVGFEALFSERRRLILYTVEHEMYEIFFEMKKDKELMDKVENKIHDDFYPGFFDWAYDDIRARGYVLERSSLSDREIHAWMTVCFNRKAPESF